VRAQLPSVYRKPGATGRGQFVALFLVELMEGMPGQQTIA
jgi:DNA-binding CsgD family transcriptional regulator